MRSSRMPAHVKVETEERLEALRVDAEIPGFDRGLRALEREMQELTAVETEAKGVLGEEACMELRKQEMWLDREFCSSSAPGRRRSTSTSKPTMRLSSRDGRCARGCLAVWGAAAPSSRAQAGSSVGISS